MFLVRRHAAAAFALGMLFLTARVASAQTPTAVDPRSGWAIGVASGLWAPVPTNSADTRPNGKAVDVSVERRLGSRTHLGAPAVRVQLGTGTGEDGRKPGFDYRRATVGLMRTFVGASRSPFTVYVAAGGGAYSISSPVERATKATVYGGIGLDVAIGSGPASIGAEIQIQSIGATAYGTTTLNARVHFR